MDMYWARHNEGRRYDPRPSLCHLALLSMRMRAGTRMVSRLTLGLDIDHLFGQLRQLLVRRSFLIECLLEQLLIGMVADLMGIRPYAAIAGHLVVLHALRGGNQASIDRGGISFHLDHLFALADQAFHTFANWPLGILAELLKNLLKTLDMAFGLRVACLAPAFPPGGGIIGAHCRD